jgi:hypothetical protein
MAAPTTTDITNVAHHRQPGSSGNSWCSSNSDVSSRAGDAYVTEVFDLEKLACTMTATRIVTSLPFQAETCDNTAVTDADQDQFDRWEDLHATTAFNSVLLVCLYEQDSTSLTFPEYVSDWFDGPESMNCGQMAANVGCESYPECDDVKYPAGYFILNSLVTLHGVSMTPQTSQAFPPVLGKINDVL